MKDNVKPAKKPDAKPAPKLSQSPIPNDPWTSCGNCTQKPLVRPTCEDIGFEVKPYCRFLRADSLGGNSGQIRPTLKTKEETTNNPTPTNDPKPVTTETRTIIPGAEVITRTTTRSTTIHTVTTTIPLSVSDGGCVTLEIEDQYKGGNYEWKLASDNLVFVGDDGNKLETPNNIKTGDKVIVRALEKVGPAKVFVRDTVTGKCRNVMLNVVWIVFSEAKEKINPATGKEDPNDTIYGFDDFTWPESGASPSTPKPHYSHISIQSDKATRVHVKIEGGATASDFDYATGDGSVCSVIGQILTKPDGSEFDLKLQAGKATSTSTPPEEKTRLIVRCKGHDEQGNHTCKATQGLEFAKLGVHVYILKIIKVAVARIEDPEEAASTLKKPLVKQYEFKDFEKHANRLLKRAVVKCEIKDHTPPGTALEVRGFADKANGGVIFIPGQNQWEYLDKIQTGFPLTEVEGFRRVAIVHETMYRFVLKERANANAESIVITSPPGSVSTPREITFWDMDANGKWSESSDKSITMTGVKPHPRGGSEVSLSKRLALTHEVNTTKVVVSIGGFVKLNAKLSDRPVIVKDMSNIATVNPVSVAILHELGHSDLNLLDIRDAEESNNATNLMHHKMHNDSYPDIAKILPLHLLRYCRRPYHYDDEKDEDKAKPGDMDECQWDKANRKEAVR